MQKFRSHEWDVGIRGCRINGGRINEGRLYLLYTGTVRHCFTFLVLIQPNIVKVTINFLKFS